MLKFSQKIEVAANVLIVVVAMLIVGVLIEKYFIAAPGQNQQARITPTVGKLVNLPGEEFTAREKTIVLALQTTCQFCNESVPFYKRLIEEVKGKNINIIAVFPQSVEEGSAHLSQLGMVGMEVKQAPVSVLETSGTPTLIITDQEGRVINYWVGKLTSDKEMEVIQEINSEGEK